MDESKLDYVAPRVWSEKKAKQELAKLEEKLRRQERRHQRDISALSNQLSELEILNGLSKECHAEVLPACPSCGMTPEWGLMAYGSTRLKATPGLGISNMWYHRCVRPACFQCSSKQINFTSQEWIDRCKEEKEKQKCDCMDKWSKNGNA